MNITRGRIGGAKKIVVYGPEGIGKSTFASRFPEPVFIDTERSTKDMDVARFDKATSWAMLLQQVKYVIEHPGICKTLVIDTADWAEQIEIESLCEQKGWTGLEDAGYGKGYTYSAETFGRFLNLLEDVIDRGIHVVMTAHAQLRKVELPEEMGAYDHWEMKTSKKVAPMIREWADAVLFANYKTRIIEVDKKKKAQGGQRVMYTTHTPFWDAKNRYGLPEELPFDYDSIRHVIEEDARRTVKTAAPDPKAMPPEVGPKKEDESFASKFRDIPDPEIPDFMKQETMDVGTKTATVQKPLTAAEIPKIITPVPDKVQEAAPSSGAGGLDKRIPKALRDLMAEAHVDEWDLQAVVDARQPGVFPLDMPVRDYPSDFINEWILPNWPKILEFVKEFKESTVVPFN